MYDRQELATQEHMLDHSPPTPAVTFTPAALCQPSMAYQMSKSVTVTVSHQ